MALFGKKKKLGSKQAQAQSVDPALVEQIHVMPQRFYVKTKKKRFGFLVLIILVLIILGGLGGGAYYWFQVAGANRQVAQQPQQPSQPETPTQTNTAPLQPSQPEEEDATTTPGTIIDLGGQTSTPTTTGPIVPNPGVVVDADKDGLSALEESLYGTNPALADTDGDGYSDGSELLNNFSPLSAGQALAQAGLFGSYSHPQYTITYPAKWRVREQDAEKQEVLFISDVGEFIEVLIVPNVNNLPIEEWFAESLPDIDLEQASFVTLNNTVGIKHPDGMSYYLIKEGDAEVIYFLVYNNGGAGTQNFLTTFNVMAKSFLLTR